MLKNIKIIVGMLLVSLLIPSILSAKAEVKVDEQKVTEHILDFKFVKRRSAWMYDLETFNPNKTMLTVKITAINQNDKEKDIYTTKLEKRGISKAFENKNYKSLKAEIFIANKKMDEKTIKLPEVKAEIINFSVRNDRWFLKVRNKTTETMEFYIEIIEENTTGMKADILSYETQNLDTESTHARTASLDNLTIGNRLTLIVKDKITKKVLAAKTITLK